MDKYKILKAINAKILSYDKVQMNIAFILKLEYIGCLLILLFVWNLFKQKFQVYLIQINC